jgi:hypothetical protein
VGFQLTLVISLPPPPPETNGPTTNLPWSGFGECPEASNNRTPDPRATANIALDDVAFVVGRNDRDEIDCRCSDEDDDMTCGKTTSGCEGRESRNSAKPCGPAIAPKDDDDGELPPLSFLLLVPPIPPVKRVLEFNEPAEDAPEAKISLEQANA